MAGKVFGKMLAGGLTIAFAFSGVGASAEEASARKAEAVQTRKAPRVDGKLTEACWRGSPAFTDFRVEGAANTLHPERTKGWVCYDDKHLYLAFECVVGDLKSLKALLAESSDKLTSGIVVYVDWRNTRKPGFFEEYRLNANGTTGYVFRPGNPQLPVRSIDELKIDTLLPAYHAVKLPTPYIKSAVSLTKDGYTIEAAIPFAMMHLGTDTSKTWALDVHRTHDLGASDKAMARSFWKSNAVDVTLFGELELDADLSGYHWDLSFSPPQYGDKAIRAELGNQTGKVFKGAMELTVTRRSKGSSTDFRQLPDGQKSVYRQPVEIRPGDKTEVLFAHTAAAEDVEARYQFVLSDARGNSVVLGGTVRKDITSGDDWAAPEPTAAERELGYIVYNRPYTVPMTYHSVPKREEVMGNLKAFGAPGEYVPLVFAIYPLEELTDITVSVGDLSGPDGASIPSASVDVRYVEHQSLWKEHWIAFSFESQENLLRHFKTLNLPGGRSQRLWLTAKLADGQKSGKYTGAVTVKSGKGETTLPVEMEVLPFKLADVDDIAYFMYHTGVERNRTLARNQREHGMTTTELYYIAQTGSHTGIPEKRTEEHRLVVDQPIGYDREAAKYVTDISGRVENSYDGWSYAQMIEMLMEEGFARKVPLIDVYAAGMLPDDRCGYQPDLVAELDKVFKARRWPQVLYYLVDEPEHSAERVAMALHRNRLLAEHGLDLPYYTALVGRDEGRDLTDKVAGIYDTWSLLRTGAADVMVRGLAEGVNVWAYGCNYAYNYGAADLRHFFGRYLWASGLRGASMWAERGYRDRFWSYPVPGEVPFDAREHYLQFAYFLSEGDEVIPTVKWEAIREGIDDHRYLRTLERIAKAAATSPDSKLKAAGKAGLALLADIRENLPSVIEHAMVADNDRAALVKSDMDGERQRVADAILSILQAGGVP